MQRHVSAASVLIVLLYATAPVRADELPNLDLEPVCRGIAAHASGPGEVRGPDLSFKQCIKSEQKVRRRLAKLWPDFSAASKANCVADTTSGLSSYTDLLTCLRMAKDAGRYRAHRR